MYPSNRDSIGCYRGSFRFRTPRQCGVDSRPLSSLVSLGPKRVIYLFAANTTRLRVYRPLAGHMRPWNTPPLERRSSAYFRQRNPPIATRRGVNSNALPVLDSISPFQNPTPDKITLSEAYAIKLGRRNYRVHNRTVTLRTTKLNNNSLYTHATKHFSIKCHPLTKKKHLSRGGNIANHRFY